MGKLKPLGENRAGNCFLRLVSRFQLLTPNLYPQHLFQLNITCFAYRYFSARFKDGQVTVFFVGIYPGNFGHAYHVAAVDAHKLPGIQCLFKKAHGFVFEV